MDAKGDDSGSDTLDQSLQRKCVVADDDSSLKQPDTGATDGDAPEQPTIEPGGSMSERNDSPATPPPPNSPSPSSPSLSSMPTVTVSQQHPSSSSSSSSSSSTKVTARDDSTTTETVPNVEDKELPVKHTTSSSTSNKEDSRGFESKVRQISNDLKDTTIADENSLVTVTDLGESASADEVAPSIPTTSSAALRASSGTASTSGLGRNAEQTTSKHDSDGYDSDRTITYDSPSKRAPCMVPETKRPKKTSKKVRFKLSKSKAYSSDPEDDYDDEEDEYEAIEVEDEEEEEVDEDTLNENIISKVMRIPLSFVSSQEEEDDCMSDVAESGTGYTEEVQMEDPPPEGGVQSILGKLSQMGKIEYLLRYEDKPGTQWESEEVLSKLCPNLIKSYEERRIKEQEIDMNYIVRRKKARQQQKKV